MIRVPIGARFDSMAGGVNEEYVDDAVAAAVADLVDAAPATLDTLKELATALGNDEDFASTMSSLIGQAQQSADNAASTANNAQSLAGSTSSKVNELEPVVARRFYGRYDFDQLGGGFGVHSLRDPDSGSPVLIRPQVTDRHFLATGAAIILHDVVEYGPTTLVNFGFQSNPDAFGNPTPVQPDLFGLDGSFTTNDAIALTWLINNPALTALDFEYLMFKIEGDPITAGKFDLAVWGIEVPRDWLP